MKIKLSQWAKENGMHYQTAWRLVKFKKFPLPVEILETGTILVETELDNSIAKDINEIKSQLDKILELLKSK